jgi:RNA polymerase sigma-70 factor (ECF subfamily)
MPYEPIVRSWLSRASVSPEDSDDLIQEAYCKVAEMDAFGHIERPAAFFFQIVRNRFISQVRRARVVRIESAIDIEALTSADESPSPERIADGRREYARMQALLERLPERCRRIFEMRKIEGLPQKEIARRLGITETIVENEGSRGLRIILAGLREQGGGISEHYESLRANRANQR